MFYMSTDLSDPVAEFRLCFSVAISGVSEMTLYLDNHRHLPKGRFLDRFRERVETIQAHGNTFQKKQAILPNKVYMTEKVYSGYKAKKNKPCVYWICLTAEGGMIQVHPG